MAGHAAGSHRSRVTRRRPQNRSPSVLDCPHVQRRS
jgi:hypothetical protein